MDVVGLAAEDIDFPTFDNSINLYYQWLDTPFKEVLDQICNRFGYFLRMSVDGKVTARRVSDANTVDHDYSDLTKVINFTPDDSFSDFTNRVCGLWRGEGLLRKFYSPRRGWGSW